MRRILAIAAMLALAVPTLAMAEEHEHGGPHAGPHPGGAAPHRAPGPMGGPHRGPPGMAPHPGGMAPHAGGMGPHAGGQFTYHGHPFHRAHGAPFAYPPGWAYRRWGIGALLPPLFLAPDYYYSDWAALGLDPPPPGFRWVRYGPDLLLVNITTGQVVETVYDAFY